MLQGIYRGETVMFMQGVCKCRVDALPFISKILDLGESSNHCTKSP
jgi:hypothetical protein